MACEIGSASHRWIHCSQAIQVPPSGGLLRGTALCLWVEILIIHRSYQFFVLHGRSLHFVINPQCISLLRSSLWLSLKTLLQASCPCPTGTQHWLAHPTLDHCSPPIVMNWTSCPKNVAQRCRLGNVQIVFRTANDMSTNQVVILLRCSNPASLNTSPRPAVSAGSEERTSHLQSFNFMIPNIP